MVSCGHVPTLKVLAAVSLLRGHLPSLKVRVVNVVDLMRLKPESEHPHGPESRARTAGDHRVEVAVLTAIAVRRVLPG
jgi:phosphoketolase